MGPFWSFAGGARNPRCIRAGSYYVDRMDTEDTAPAILFEALIVPHRSLSRRGRAWVIAMICGGSGIGALRFLLSPAWPMIGFSLGAAGLAVLLLLTHTRPSRASEFLVLHDGALRVVRTDAAGRRRERRLPAGWLNVVLDAPPGRVPRLLLTARGLREEVGAALGEQEKRDLAAALSTALHRMRHPEFDNPQLRA